VEDDVNNQELSQTEESIIDWLDSESAAWAEGLSEARKLAAEAEAKIVSFHENLLLENGANYKQRRDAVRDVQLMVVSDMVNFRDHARRDVNTYASVVSGGSSVLGIALGGDINRIEKALISLARVRDVHLVKSDDDLDKRRKVGIVNIGSERSINPYHHVFVRESLAKLGLAQLMVLHPETAAALLNPANLANLPDHFRQFIATDIANDKNSLVLNYMLVKRKVATSFFEYLNENDLATAAKEQARAISIGARAMDGCECPMNALGICRTVADRIDKDQLPKDILDDMQKKQQVAGARLATQLLNFSKANSVSQLWSMEAEVSAQQQVNTMTRASSKRRAQNGSPAGSAVATPKNFADSLVAPLKKEIQAPPRILISQAGTDGVSEVCRDEAADHEAVIDSILSSKKFADYMDRYRHDKSLEPFLREAIKTIMISPTYRDAPGLLKVAYRNANRYVAKSGDELTRYRLSGKTFPGYSGDAVSSTRISFAVGNSDGVRRIEIQSIDHKTKIDKMGKSGRFFTK
jgi:hypothetical protein